jgi:hypothetical protein
MIRWLHSRKEIQRGCSRMANKMEKKIDLKNLKSEEKMKYEVARELGYLDKVLSTGWKSLTAKESGRIGGIITKRKREQKQS